MASGWLLLLTLAASSLNAHATDGTCDCSALTQATGEVKTGLQELRQEMLSQLHGAANTVAGLQQEEQEMVDELDSAANTVSGLAANRSSGRERRDCAEMYNSGVREDGVYTVYSGGRSMHVYCDMTTDGGAWTVFQRRKDGSTNFLRNWDDYAKGFGDADGEFWIGNDNLHELTGGPRQKLRIELGDFEEDRRYATYDDFAVGSARVLYRLTALGIYSGDAGDSMTTHRFNNFSTPDQDNDGFNRHCALDFKSGWWHGQWCLHSNLNGQYLRGAHTSWADGVEWQHWRGLQYSLKFSEMKIKPY